MEEWGLPGRLGNEFPRFSFSNYPLLTFEQPDIKAFRNLGIAIEALKKGGNAACVMNAANEEVVHMFLHNKIGFLEMTDVIQETMMEVPFIKIPTLEEYYRCDAAARQHVASLVNERL